MSHNTRPQNGFFQSLIKATMVTAMFAIVVSGKPALASNHTFTDYAKVIHVEPSFRYVTVKVPQKTCSPGYNNHSGHHNSNSRHHHRSDRRQHLQSARNHRKDSSGAVFIGGIIGGAIGHEVSKSISGRSNVAATVTGALIGSTLAGAATQSGAYQVQHYAHNGSTHQNRHHQSHNKPNKHHHRQHRHNNHQRCTTTTQSRQERRPNGYNVTYIYHGRTFHTHTRQHPGQRIAVQIALSTH